MEMTSTMSSGAIIEKRAVSLLRNVYLYMVVALSLTGFIGLMLSTNQQWFEFLIPSKTAFYGWVIAEFAIVLGLSFLMNKISSIMAFVGFMLYATINGITLSIVFYVYDLGSIATSFFVTAGLFSAMAVLGTVTKKDLSKMGGIMMQLLIGLIIASIVNFFLKSQMMEYLISFAGIAIFTGLTAYDAWKIRKWNDAMGEDADPEQVRKLSIIGALSLYLDFINIFLFMLRLFGRRK